MFDFIRKHMKAMQFMLVVLIVPSFAFFGIEGYTRLSEGGRMTVAEVAGQNITQSELEAAHRQQIERLRREMPTIDAKLLDTPQMRERTLDELVRERVMLVAADKDHLAPNDDRLRRIFVSDPQFAFLRNPDGSVNKDVLAQQGMSSEQFAQRLTQDLARRQVLLGIGGTVFPAPADSAAAMDALLQQREVQILRFDTKDFTGKADPTEAQLEAYYKDPRHAARFTAPEQASIEYVVLDLNALKADISVSEDDLRKYYTENAARYTTPEERRASHILINAPKDAPADVRAKAKAKAEALLAQVKANPDSFAELAKKNSDDPGSAERGGDLDYFSRGAMVKPFEDAAFALKPGEVSGVVESDFGYHIIKLTGVRGGEKRSFEAVRPELENEVKTQLAQRRFTEIASDFSNMVYEQPDSLQPVADKFKLELHRAQGVTHTPAPGATGPLASPKFLEQIFGSEALRNKRNTEAVETGSNQLVSGRVVSYSPAHLRPFAEVKPEVLAAVKAELAAADARKAGEARLASLKDAAGATLDSAPITVSRAQRHELPAALVDAVLRADSTKLPAFVGVDLGADGYAIAKIDKVLGRDPAAGDGSQLAAAYAQSWTGAEMAAYYDALKARFKVKIEPVKQPAADSASTQQSAGK
jgi:peptidyl-prolyl cis-trans isomerase D